MNYLRLGTSYVTAVSSFGALVAVLFSPLTWLARRMRYALLAERLGEGPDYLLEDVGLTRSDLKAMSRTGRPTAE